MYSSIETIVEDSIQQSKTKKQKKRKHARASEASLVPCLFHHIAHNGENKTKQKNESYRFVLESL